jgi:5-methyltetrahydrofolate--homocysteine methyltransferase
MDTLKAGKLDTLDGEIEARLVKRAEAEEKRAPSRTDAGEPAGSSTGGVAVAIPQRSAVATDVDVPAPPFWGSRVVTDLELDEIYRFINRVALYRGQWMFKKGARSDADYAAFVASEVDPLFDRLCRQCRDERILQPAVVYGYFPCHSQGQELIVYDPQDHGRQIERFTWPRQAGRKRLCVSDFFRSVESGERDVIGMMCVTMGRHVSEVTRALFEGDSYTEYLYMHGMGVESAEALAELWHRRMRGELSIDGEDSPDIRGLFTQKYRGSRYSFGYPAVPDMSDQEKLFRLLDPGRIACELSENWQIEPEQSTSAIIVHHPEAKYFNV